MRSHYLPSGFQPCPMAQGSLVKSQWGGGWPAVCWCSDFGLGWGGWCARGLMWLGEGEGMGFAWHLVASTRPRDFPGPLGAT